MGCTESNGRGHQGTPKSGCACPMHMTHIASAERRGSNQIWACQASTSAHDRLDVSQSYMAAFEGSCVRFLTFEGLETLGYLSSALFV